MNNNRNISLLLLLIVISISVLGTLAIWEIHTLNMVKKMEFMREVNKDFFANPIDTTIMNAIDDNRPILIKNGGKSDEYDLDNYLDHLQNVKWYLDADVMNIRDVYGEYCHYVQAAYHNEEVMRYIHELRKTEKDSAYYDDFEKLAMQMIEIDNKANK